MNEKKILISFTILLLSIIGVVLSTVWLLATITIDNEVAPLYVLVPCFLLSTGSYVNLKLNQLNR